jgi:transposase IS3/IS911 family protein
MKVEKKTSDLSREYGVNESTIRPWIAKYGTIITSTGETITNDEIIKLQKRNRELEQENEILKKAVAIFSKNRR